MQYNSINFKRPAIVIIFICLIPITIYLFILGQPGSFVELIICLTLIIWLIVNYYRKVIVSETGITYKGIFSSYCIEWQKINYYGIFILRRHGGGSLLSIENRNKWYLGQKMIFVSITPRNFFKKNERIKDDFIYFEFNEDAWIEICSYLEKHKAQLTKPL